MGIFWFHRRNLFTNFNFLESLRNEKFDPKSTYHYTEVSIRYYYLTYTYLCSA